MSNNRITFNEFKSRAQKRFGRDAFLFNEAEYVNVITPIHITCSKCGNIMHIKPCDFLRRRGCNVCTPIDYSHASHDIMLKRFKASHGDEYDYSLITEYFGMDAEYNIICKKHGTFQQSAYRHIRGQGCPRCKAEKAKNIICGVGINDSDERIKINGELIPSYSCWVNMIKRCYGHMELKKRPTYLDCCVCEEWKYFSNFKKWFDDPANGYIIGYQLDKDILFAGNRVYSPETCCFVPNLINSHFKTKPRKNNDCSEGVYYRKSSNKYHANFAFNGKQRFLGSFDSNEDAANAYAKAKEESIHEIAQKFFEDGKITNKVYDALITYKCKTK